MNEYAKYGRIDITSVKLCATQWAFALPRHMNWKAIRAVPPKLEEPAGHCQSCEVQDWKGSQTLQGCNKVATCKYGRYFIHCIQHWILRDSRTNPFKTMKLTDVYQETILVDNHGQIYKIKAYPNMPDDWGVYYFSLHPDTSYTPLSPSQIEAVKDVRIREACGWEGLPSQAPFQVEAIHEAIRNAVEYIVDPLASQGIFEHGHVVSRLAELPDLQIWQRPLQVKPVEDIVEKKTLTEKDQYRLWNAYIMAHYGKGEQKEEGMSLLRHTLKCEMHKNAWPRIDHMTRTMLAHRIAKRFHITFPSAQEKKERAPSPIIPGYI